MRSSARQRWMWVATLGAFAAAPRAQEPESPPPPPAAQPAQQQPAQQQPAQQQPTPSAPAIDPTNAAAEILRRRLGLKPGPEGTPPAGPVAVPRQPTADETPARSDEPQPQAPGQIPLPIQGQGQGQGQEQGQAAAPQQSQGQPPRGQEPQPRDPSDTAADAIRRLLPGARPPEVAPIPDATGTPESVAKPNGPAPGREPGAAPAARTTTPWHATLAFRYRSRHAGERDDQDLVGRLSVDVGGDDDPLSFHMRGRGFANLDGRPDDSFGGLDHSFGDDVNTRLYGAWFDLRAIPGLSLLRAGRQDLDETPVALPFDGLRVDSERFGGPWALWLTAYGGVPVHYFATAREGDSVYGAGGGFAPWRGGRVRLDWMQLHDEFLAIDTRDELLGVRWWQRVADFALSGLHTWRDGKPRDLQLSANGELAGVADVRLGWRELLTTQRLQVTELDPFVTVTTEYLPYRQLELSLTRELIDKVTATAGLDVRRLYDDNAQATFNREFDHYRLDVTWSDALVEGLSLSLAGNQWRTSGEWLQAITGELAYRPDQDLRLALGAGYDLFRYDSLADRERVRVRSFYLRADRRFGEALRLDGGYELLRDDLDEFHTFRLGVTWTF